jgi:uncharacterized membrane protein
MDNEMQDIIEKSKSRIMFYIRYFLLGCMISLFGSFLIENFPNHPSIGITISLVGVGLSIIFFIKLIKDYGLQTTKGGE